MVFFKMKEESGQQDSGNEQGCDPEDAYDMGLRDLSERVETRQRIYKVARNACFHIGAKFHEIRPSSTITLDMDVKAQFQSITIHLKAKRNGLLIYGIFPLKGSAECEDRLIRYLTLANRGLLDGCFDYDHEEGKIRYKCWLPVYAELNEEAVKTEIMTCANMLVRYGDGLANVLIAKADPDEEISLIDGK